MKSINYNYNYYAIFEVFLTSVLGFFSGVVVVVVVVVVVAVVVVVVGVVVVVAVVVIVGVDALHCSL